MITQRDESRLPSVSRSTMRTWSGWVRVEPAGGAGGAAVRLLPGAAGDRRPDWRRPEIGRCCRRRSATRPAAGRTPWPGCTAGWRAARSGW